MTPRGTLGLCCIHITQLVTHAAIYTLPFILQLCHKPFGILQRVTKGQVMIYCKNFMTSTLLNIGPKVFSKSGYRTRNFLLPPLIFLRTIKIPFPGIWESIYFVKWRAGRKLGFPYLEIRVAIKIFKLFEMEMKIIVLFYVYLFFRHLILTDLSLKIKTISSSVVREWSIYFVWKKSCTCEEDGVHLRISFWDLLMTFKKLLNCANKKQSNFNIYNVAFFTKKLKKNVCRYHY